MKLTANSCITLRCQLRSTTIIASLIILFIIWKRKIPAQCYSNSGPQPSAIPWRFVTGLRIILTPEFLILYHLVGEYDTALILTLKYIKNING